MFGPVQASGRVARLIIRAHRNAGMILLASSLLGASACRSPGPPPGPARLGGGVGAGEPTTRGIPRHDADDVDEAVGAHGAVTSAERHASEVGLAILQAGGNAIDAAVAVGFSLAVTHPTAGNLGGGGFLVLRLADGSTFALDYREVAPSAATADMYVGPDGKVTRDSRVGARAAGIPGNVAGFWFAHQRWGRLPWKDVVAPALALARDGHVLDRFHAEDIEWAIGQMKEYGFADSVAYFSRPDGTPLREGDLWKQPDLAATLSLIAEGGAAAFYEGPFAEDLAARVRALGGIWTAADLAAYRPRLREPLVFEYREHTIVSMPPPSAGGIVLRQLLVASEVLRLWDRPWQSPESAHLYVEALRRIYADRNLRIADPDFVEVPLAQLTDEDYVERRMADINRGRATPSSAIKAGEPGPAESLETTHFSVVDAEGNAVANTFTLNGSFGSKQIVAGTGLILNNEMDDFTAKPGEPNMFGLVQGPQNGIAPGKRMLSSMTPTIVVKNGRLRAILGSPGGPRISTTVGQILLQLIDHQRSITDAVRAPRIHHQWLPDRIVAEQALDPSLVRTLEAMGHEVALTPAIGHANCIEVDPATLGFRAVADQARDGGAAVAY